MTKEMYEDLLERNKLQISELNTLTEEQDRHIVELEKENTELKNRNSELAGQKASLERWLGEAKRLLKEFNRVLKEHSLYHNDLYKRAEQFLNSEIEK